MLLLPLLAGAAILVTTGCNPIRQMKIDKEMLEARVMQLEQDRESVEASGAAGCRGQPDAGRREQAAGGGDGAGDGAAAGARE
jgi:hypothetical protein